MASLPWNLKFQQEDCSDLDDSLSWLLGENELCIVHLLIMDHIDEISLKELRDL